MTEDTSHDLAEADVAPPQQTVPSDIEMAVEFLCRFYGDDLISLTCLPNSGVGIEQANFRNDDSDSIDRMRTWLTARSGEFNLYFTVNPVIRAIKTKPKKEDIRGAKWLHADIDPRIGEDIDEEKARNLAKLHNYKPAPTVIIDSGGGLQAFWKLDSEFETAGDHEKTILIEGKNRKIAIDFDGDNCHNIDRIMRIPGTLNVPNAVKVKKGRKLCLATLLEFNDNVYGLEAFTAIGGMLPKQADVIPLHKIQKDIQLEGFPQLTEFVRAVIMHGTHPSDANHWKSRSEVVHYVCIQCSLAGLSKEQLLSVLMNPKFGISQSILDKGRKAQQYGLRQILRARQKADLEDKPTIEFDTNKLSAILDSAEHALMMQNHDLYQSHGKLVRIIDQKDGIPRMNEVEPHWLLEKFIDSAKWVKRSGKDLKPFSPKIDFAHHYLSRAGEWKLPYLEKITMTPTLRHDLTLIQEIGYDEKSETLYQPGMAVFPKIEENPTRQDAELALAQLIAPFAFFPFVPDGDTSDWKPIAKEGERPSTSQSVVLSAMMTAVIRPALRTAPLHGIDAPLQGSGKSLIADCASLLATGSPAAMISLTYSDEEDRKRYFSTLSEGNRIIVLDNVEKVIKGDAICTILTQPTWKDRILGISKMSEVSTNALFIATGNNLVFGDDMTRRVVVARLDSREERPFERRFPIEPRQFVLQYRGILVAAVLTMVRAYITAGRPLESKIKPMGSFEDYSIIRETLLWLDRPDPVNYTRIAQEDPNRSMTLEVMQLWWNEYQGKQVALSKFIAALLENDQSPTKTHFRELLGNNGRVSSIKLTRWFKDRDGKIYDGKAFIRTHTPEGTMIRLKWDGREEVQSEPEVPM